MVEGWVWLQRQEVWIVRIPWFIGVYDWNSIGVYDWDSIEVYDWDVNGRDEVGDLDLALNCSTVLVWKWPDTIKKTLTGCTVIGGMKIGIWQNTEYSESRNGKH